MDWTDQGIVLSARAHGENSAIAVLLTREHGRHAGLARGARSPRKSGVLQPGNLVAAQWRARIAEHLGQYLVEPLHSHAGLWLDDPLRLAALSAACAVAEAALPEREPHPAVFDGLRAWLDGLPGPFWAEAYVGWELGLLGELGFGLELDRCAVSGSNDFLAYVSPRTGRAVSQAAGEPFHDRLLPLPGFLIGQGGGGPAEIIDGLALTGHFLERHAFAGAPLPAARLRLAERLATIRAAPPPPIP
ncbi:MAG: DNA repair protein RecO [Azospirillum sp.]|nr:DNA repair protein RecO [Azospirillum sp.]